MGRLDIMDYFAESMPSISCTISVNGIRAYYTTSIKQQDRKPVWEFIEGINEGQNREDLKNAYEKIDKYF